MAAASAGPFLAFPKLAVEQSIPARFEQQVARYPDHLAVQTATESLSYRQLEDRANRLAHGILARRGEGAEPIGLLMHQGAALVAAILGILKAGKIYVPVDPSHPMARTASTLDDAGAALLVIDGAAPEADRRVASTARAVVTVDELGSGQPPHPPHLPLSGDTLAYIYYTSGSTGRPKGVFDTHRNVLHNIMRYTNSLQLSSLDRLTLLQSPGFSGAVSSLFSALLNGAALFPYDVARDGMGRALANWLVREQIAVYHSVPMLFRSFLRGDVRFPSIRIIRLEGDAASRVDVELFHQYFEPECVLVNGLGATETGITRQFFMNQGTSLAGGTVPIGYATADMHGMLLDDAGQEAGVGVVGQIAIRSRYLALGYWGQPDLSRAAFLPGPAGSGERIYLTGDLGRLHPDGCLEYLGRKDSGLKIRGHRVEPAEVERALLSLEAIREAAVVSREDPKGIARLVAYLVPAGEPPVPVPVLRRALAGTLPDYMIPTRFMFLDQLPLSENGKVDRKALPAPAEGRPERASAFVPPRDPLEERLVGIWEELLGIQPVGVTDNFFDLGGDSLLAASLVLSLEELTKNVLPAATIVAAPTIEELASVIRGGVRQGSEALVPLRTGGTRPPLFCATEHGGAVGAGFAALSRRLGADQPFYALQAAGLSGDEPPLTIEAIAARYVEAVRGVQPHGPYYLGGRCFGGVVALEMAHQLIAQGEAVGLLFFLDVTPEDFPGLVPDAARRRFRWQRLMEQLRSEVALVPQRRAWKRAPYVIREIGRKIWAPGRELIVRWCIRLGYPLPRRLRAVALVNRQAFALYAPRTYPGRLTLVLRAEHASLYSSNPVRDWGRLAAGGYDIHYLEGSPSGFSQEPQPQRIADLLGAALPAAGGASPLRPGWSQEPGSVAG